MSKKKKMVDRDDTLFGREIGKAFVHVERALNALDNRKETDSSEAEMLHDVFNDLHSIWTSVREAD